MQIYPFNSPIILTDALFSLNGGLGTGSFSSYQLQSAYMIAEMQVTNYIGTPLLPVAVTGTFGYEGSYRIATDYGYVSSILSVNVISKQGGINCSVQNNEGCAFIYNDTFGYIDFRRISSVCACGYPFWNPTYQVQFAYVAGLPTGTANQPGMLRALTILAQIELDDAFPGVVGVNESVGAVGVQEFKSLDYWEKRAENALIKTALGDDARSQRAKKLIDMSVKKARRVLLIG